MTDPDDPLMTAMRRQIVDARRMFLEEVAVVLREGERLAGSLATAIGEVSGAQALEAWRHEMVIRLTRMGQVEPVYREEDT